MLPEDLPRARVTWTYDDLRTFPDDRNRYEIIDGALLVTPAPTITHQTLSKRIQFALMQQVEHRGLGLVFAAPVDVIFSATSVVEPDLVVVRTARRPIVTQRGIAGSPDLIIEILSPGTASTDRGRKLKLYADRGVAEYWIVDPDDSAIEVLVLGPEGYVLHGRFGPGDRVTSTLFQLDLPLDPLFASF
ncbi:MAG: Uma2 family endonuclease [Deltaproteobacteria bacterium]|nr:Uma2 family endonuclease [Deltaproteobacteria bacterium]